MVIDKIFLLFYQVIMAADQLTGNNLWQTKTSSDLYWISGPPQTPWGHSSLSWELKLVCGDSSANQQETFHISGQSTHLPSRQG